MSRSLNPRGCDVRLISIILSFILALFHFSDFFFFVFQKILVSVEVLFISEVFVESILRIFRGIEALGLLAVTLFLKYLFHFFLQALGAVLK